MPRCYGCKVELRQGGVAQEEGEILCVECDAKVNTPATRRALCDECQQRSDKLVEFSMYGEAPAYLCEACHKKRTAKPVVQPSSSTTDNEVVHCKVCGRHGYRAEGVSREICRTCYVKEALGVKPCWRCKLPLGKHRIEGQFQERYLCDLCHDGWYVGVKEKIQSEQKNRDAGLGCLVWAGAFGALCLIGAMMKK